VYREIEPSIVRYDYDPAKATQLIADLGYTRGTDGLFRTDSGQLLDVELRTVAVDIHQKTTLAVADGWRSVGIAVDPVVIPPARQGDLEYRAGFPAFQLFGAEPTVDYLPRLYSSRAPVPETRYVGTNYSRYQSAEWDELLDTLFSTIPQPDRTRALAGVVHHMTEQLNIISLFLRDDSILLDNRLRNIAALHADGSTHGWNAFDWDLVN
jgi:peptide/nickel transport system substrate-binding protein